MTKNKRKMVRVLDIEEFAANKQALMHFESQMEELGGLKVHLSDSKVLQLMSRTCSTVWGDGRDLYLASQERTLAMITRMVVGQFDEAISEAVSSAGRLVAIANHLHEDRLRHHVQLSEGKRRDQRATNSHAPA